jgi:hypothetical protein
MIDLAAPQASVPGLIGAIAGVITALTVLVGAIIGGLKVVLPLLRDTKALRRETASNTAQLGIIHTLVNSTLTAALQAVLDGARREVFLLEDAQRMRNEAGMPVTEDQQALLGATQRRVEELTLSMRDRERQTRAADIQIATEHDRKAAERMRLHEQEQPDGQP